MLENSFSYLHSPSILYSLIHDQSVSVLYSGILALKRLGHELSYYWCSLRLNAGCSMHEQIVKQDEPVEFLALLSLL